MTKSKRTVKTTVTRKSRSNSSEELAVLQLENNVPLPKRGMRDPEFLTKASALLSQMKIKQSFVVPRGKLYAIKKISKTDFSHLVLRSSLIKPDNRFARVWRLK